MRNLAGELRARGDAVSYMLVAELLHGAGIRSVDMKMNHVLILGGAQWDSNFDVFGPPFDSNAMYTYKAFRDKYNVSVWRGEFGENTDE